MADVMQEMTTYAGMKYGDLSVREEVRAWDVGVLGLVVAEMEIDNDRPCWTITHTGSGYSVGKAFGRCEDAVGAVHALAPLVDWTLPRDVIERTVRETPGLRYSVMGAMSAARIEHWKRP